MNWGDYNKPGVYKIQSLVKPERVYIGSSLNLRKRHNCHLSSLKYNRHHSIKLQNHYNKYGKDDLIWEVIEVIENATEDILLEEEQKYYLIFKYENTLFPYFNCSPVAKNPMLGRKHKPETIAQYKLRKASDETKKKMSDSQKRIGNRPPNHTGEKQTEEHKSKRKLLKPGHKIWLGKKHTEKTKSKMSISATGKHTNKGLKQDELWVIKRMENTRRTCVIKKLELILKSLIDAKGQ